MKNGRVRGLGWGSWHCFELRHHLAAVLSQMPHLWFPKNLKSVPWWYCFQADEASCGGSRFADAQDGYMLVQKPDKMSKRPQQLALDTVG